MIPVDPLTYARTRRNERLRAAGEARLARSVRTARRSNVVSPAPSPRRRFAARFRPQPAAVACC